jgi:hypothetical protein
MFSDSIPRKSNMKIHCAVRKIIISAWNITPLLIQPPSKVTGSIWSGKSLRLLTSRRHLEPFS